MASCLPCGRSWSGTVSAHCTVCHEHFSTVKNFDAHKPNRRGCPDPAAQTRRKADGTVVPVLKKSERGVWIGWSEDPRFADEDAA